MVSRGTTHLVSDSSVKDRSDRLLSTLSPRVNSRDTSPSVARLCVGMASVVVVATSVGEVKEYTPFEQLLLQAGQEGGRSLT